MQAHNVKFQAYAVNSIREGNSTCTLRTYTTQIARTCICHMRMRSDSIYLRVRLPTAFTHDVVVSRSSVDACAV